MHDTLYCFVHCCAYCIGNVRNPRGDYRIPQYINVSMAYFILTEHLATEHKNNQDVVNDLTRILSLSKDLLGIKKFGKDYLTYYDEYVNQFNAAVNNPNDARTLHDKLVAFDERMTSRDANKQLAPIHHFFDTHHQFKQYSHDTIDLLYVRYNTKTRMRLPNYFVNSFGSTLLITMVFNFVHRMCMKADRTIDEMIEARTGQMTDNKRRILEGRELLWQTFCKEFEWSYSPLSSSHQLTQTTRSFTQPGRTLSGTVIQPNNPPVNMIHVNDLIQRRIAIPIGVSFFDVYKKLNNNDPTCIVCHKASTSNTNRSYTFSCCKVNVMHKSCLINHLRQSKKCVCNILFDDIKESYEVNHPFTKAGYTYHYGEWMN